MEFTTEERRFVARCLGIEKWHYLIVHVFVRAPLLALCGVGLWTRSVPLFAIALATYVVLEAGLLKRQFVQLSILKGLCEKIEKLASQ